MGLQRAQVDLDDLVVEVGRVGEHLVVGAQVVGDGIGRIGDRLPAGRLQVAGHGVVVAEQRGGGTDLGPHIADRALAGRRDAGGAGAEVLDDAAGATLDGEDVGHLQDDVLGGGPAVQLARQVHADQAGPADVEGEPGHHVDRIGAADADGDHAQAAGVGGVAVGADHHAAREGVVLEHHLVDDAGARLPEAQAVLGRHRLEEVVHLGVVLLGGQQVDQAVLLGLDQVVAVHGGWHGHLGQAGGDELQQRHLGGGVLHGHPVGVQVVVGDPTLDLGGGIGQVGDQDLLRQRQGTAQAGAGVVDTLVEAGVCVVDKFDRRAGGDGHGVPSIAVLTGVVAQRRRSHPTPRPQSPRGAPWSAFG